MRINGTQDLVVQLALENQQRAQDAQVQVSSGKRAQDFKELAEDTQSALSTRSLLARNQNFQDAISSARVDLEANDARLNAVYDISRDVVDSLKTAIGQSRGDGLETTLDQTFEQLVGILNTQQNGRFIFGGTRTDTPPVNVSNRTQLTATGAANAFDNLGPNRNIRIADNLDLDVGVQADTVAQNIFQVFENLSNLGPFPDDDLSQADVTALQAEVANLETAIQDVQRAQTDNGLNLNRLTSAREQLEQESIALERFKSEVEDVDIAEAISRLRNDQTALEASFRSISLLQNTSLLNFI